MLLLQKRILSFGCVDNSHDGKISIRIVSPVYLPGGGGGAGESGVRVCLRRVGCWRGAGCVVIETGYWECQVWEGDDGERKCEERRWTHYSMLDHCWGSH